MNTRNALLRTTAVGAVLCAVLRLLELRFAFEGTLPVQGHPLGTLMPILLLLTLAALPLLGLRLPKGRRSAEDAFDFSEAQGTLPLTLLVGGAFLTLFSGIALLLQNRRLLSPSILAGMAALLLSGAFLLSASFSLRRSKPAGLPLLLPVCVSLGYLVTQYMQSAKTPTLALYYPQILALAALSCGQLALCGYCFGNGSDRQLLPLSCAVTVLTAVVAVSLPLPLTLYLLGGALYLLGALLGWKAA